MPAKPKYASRAEAQAARAKGVSRPADVFVNGKLLLGSPSLTAGISGDGPLTLPEIEAWLADPKNHEPFEFVLPLGLRSLAGDVRIPADNPLTRAKIELGRQLFVDPRLSGPGRNHSCILCHLPGNGYAGVELVGDPATGIPPRVAPSVLNRIFSESQFWDGRRASLEEQVTEPIFAPHEMNSSPAALEKFLQDTPGYRRQFEAIFGEVSVQNAGRALASFVRALVSGESPYDVWAELELWKARDLTTATAAERMLVEQLQSAARKRPFSRSAQQGHALFVGKAQCQGCHSGPNFTDEKFHNVGAGWSEPLADAGRERVTGRSEDRGAFKTPTLRNLRGNAPYLHNQQYASLEELVDWLSDGASPNPQLDPLVRRLDLSAAEKRQLVAFLESLNGRVPATATGRLPMAAE